jgi:hypothetical protein
LEKGEKFLIPSACPEPCPELVSVIVSGSKRRVREDLKRDPEYFWFFNE